MNETGKRKTLLQRQVETKVRDPAAHARHQVSELDKTAKRSKDKRKRCNDQIEADLKEIGQIDEQIERINERYLPLCTSLKEKEEEKARLMAVLEQCMKEEKSIMNNTKNIVHTRMIDDSKLNKKMATLELQMLRGYTMESPSKSKTMKSGTLPPI